MVQYIETPVRAGFPSPAMDYIEQRIDLNEVLVRHPLSTFIVENVGESMVNAFIPPKAKLVVDRSLTPKNGDIVVALVGGEYTVKFFKKNDFRCWLIPANPKFPDMEFKDEMELQIWGVVTSIITEAKDVRRCML